MAVPKPIRTIANLNKLIDAVGDCKLIPDANGLTIALPGKLYVLSPELDIKNSPMALTDVEGDFVAQVKVAGEVMPGRTPVEKMPFAFHGAGLLLWKDKDNYVRLERTARERPDIRTPIRSSSRSARTASRPDTTTPIGRPGRPFSAWRGVRTA